MRNQTGKNNPNYKNGITVYIHHCKICNKKITVYSRYCQKCFHKQQRGENNCNWVGGKPKCVDCGKTRGNYNKNRLRCRKCYGKIISKRQRGENNPNWNKGISTTKHYCKDCGKRLTDYKALRCRSCARKYQYKLNPQYNLPFNGKRGLSGKTRVKHHINLNRKNNRRSNILKLSSKKHVSLHHRAYDYLVKIGKVRQYIRWFLKTYKGNKKR